MHSLHPASPRIPTKTVRYLLARPPHAFRISNKQETTTARLYHQNVENTRRSSRKRKIPQKGSCKYVSPAQCPPSYSDCHCTMLTVSNTEHGEGAPNAPGHTEGHKPGEAPVASDSGSTDQGIAKGTNQPGEIGIEGKPVGSVPENLKGTRGT